MDKILFIDALNLVWRACVKFGQPLDQTEDDSIIFTFNFFRNLRPLIEMFSPDKCFFVLEGHPQFRYDLYSDYKANRIIKRASKQEIVDNVSKARDEIIRLIKYLPITIAQASKYECDDVIATLCENLKEEQITVLSGDSDFIQLLQKNYKSLQVYNPVKKEFMQPPNYPYVIWKCLNGDKADNIKGILKPKKALETASNPELFRKFMDIEENRANFNINRQLIEFRQVPEEEILLEEGQTNFLALKEEFARMKFESIINDLSWKKYTSTFNCIKY